MVRGWLMPSGGVQALLPETLRMLV